MKCNCTCDCDHTSARRRRTSTTRRRKGVYAKKASKWAHKNRKNRVFEKKNEYLRRIRAKQ